ASSEVSSPVPAARQGQRPWPRTLHQSKAEAEVRRIQEVLHKHNHKRARAARELGISRVGLYKKLQKYGLLVPGAHGESPAGRAGPGKEKTVWADLPELPICKGTATELAPSPGSGFEAGLAGGVETAGP